MRTLNLLQMNPLDVKTVLTIYLFGKSSPLVSIYRYGLLLGSMPYMSLCLTPTLKQKRGSFCYEIYCSVSKLFMKNIWGDNFVTKQVLATSDECLHFTKRNCNEKFIQ